MMDSILIPTVYKLALAFFFCTTLYIHVSHLYDSNFLILSSCWR